MKVFLTSLAITLMAANLAFSQQTRQRRPSRGGGGPGTPGSSTLERAGLKLGQTMPDISIHDADGKEFRMTDLKGKHSVIVFGCLT